MWTKGRLILFTIIISGIMLVGIIIEPNDWKMYVVVAFCMLIIASAFRGYKADMGFQNAASSRLNTDGVRAEPLKKCGKTMSQDLCRRHRSKFSVFPIIFGILMLGICVYNDTALYIKIPAALIAALMIIYGICRLTAVVTRTFIKKLYRQTNCAELIEEDYMSGRLFAHGVSGINIGTRYVLMFSDMNIAAAQIQSIESVSVKMIYEKEEHDGIFIYARMDYELTLKLKQDSDKLCGICPQEFRLLLDKLQTEAVLYELKNIGAEIYVTKEVRT